MFWPECDYARRRRELALVKWWQGKPKSYQKPGKSILAKNHKKNGGKSHNQRRSR